MRQPHGQAVRRSVRSLPLGRTFGRPSGSSSDPRRPSARHDSRCPCTDGGRTSELHWNRPHVSPTVRSQSAAKGARKYRWAESAAAGCCLSLLALACGEEATQSHGPTVADSAGIEVVTIRPPDLATSTWRVAGDPLLTIGSAAGSEVELLSQVQSARSLDDGSVLVADGASRELRVFDRSGAPRMTLGGDGEGPGEYRGFGFVAPRADGSISVYDNRLRRVTRYDEQMAFLGSESLIGFDGPPLPQVAGFLQSGAMVTFGSLPFEPQGEGPYFGAFAVGVFSPTSGSYTVVDTINASEESLTRRDDRPLRAYVPFGRKSDVAVSDSMIFLLDASDQGSVRIHRENGELARILRFEVPRVHATPEDVDDWADAYVAVYGGGNPDLEEWWRYGFDRTPAPDSIPLFRSLESDADGHLCLERYAPTEDGTREYWCFTDRGEFVRALDLGQGVVQGFHPHFAPQLEIGRSHVLAVWTDAVGVEQVRKYSLVR